MQELQKIAVVIDADNTQLSKMGDVLQEISTHGRIVVKRAYGNWQKPSLKNWEGEIKRLAIKAEHQFDYVSGKNATDIALVIDTIELLYTHLYDAFVIVSSDSDYTPLAIKLRESGVYVMGVGEKKTPISFRNSCDEFLFLENCSTVLDDTPVETTEPPAAEEKTKNPSIGKAGRSSKETTAPGKPASAAKKSEPETFETEENTEESAERTGSMEEIHVLLKKAYDTYQDDDGFVNVAKVGLYLRRTKSDFDCRTYGFKKLHHLLQAFPDKYEVTKVQRKGTTIVMYRCKEQNI